MLFITQLFNLQYLKRHHKYKSTNEFFALEKHLQMRCTIKIKASGEKMNLKNGLKERRKVS
jgi:hypothetical protein